MFIHNDDLYNIIGGEVIKVELDSTLFLTFREALSHPFFGIFEQILNAKGGKLAKPNKQTMDNTGCMNKFYALRELFASRDEFVGDFILPYSIKQNEMPVFLDYVRKTMGDKVVFKKDCIQEGKGVMFKDLTRENSYTKSTKIMENHKHRGYEVLIAPAYEIDREYRCYFTHNDDDKKVFSIKQRVNSKDIDVFAQDNIQIYKNISVKWHEVKRDSDVFRFGETLTKKMLDFMSYDTGTLEFARTKDDKIVFFEVNQMVGPLPFAGDDTVQINEYYQSILDKMFS